MVALEVLAPHSLGLVDMDMDHAAVEDCSLSHGAAAGYSQGHEVRTKLDAPAADMADDPEGCGRGDAATAATAAETSLFV